MPPRQCKCFEGRREGKKAFRFVSERARLDQTVRKKKKKLKCGWYAQEKSSFLGILSKCAQKQHTRKSSALPVDCTAKLVRMALKVTYRYIGRREMKGGRRVGLLAVRHNAGLAGR